MNFDICWRGKKLGGKKDPRVFNFGVCSAGDYLQLTKHAGQNLKDLVM